MGDLLRHFSVEDIHGHRVEYGRAIWQRKPLVLVTGADDVPIAGIDGIAGDDVAVVVTRDAVPGLPAPGIAIVDTWGEIAKVWAADSSTAWPGAPELAEWVSHVRMRCPECEGEVR